MIVRIAGLALILAMAGGGAALAQSSPSALPPPVVKCTYTPKEIAAGRASVIKFFQLVGDERVALADQGYIQYNPAFKKRAEDNKVSDYQEFKDWFSTAGVAKRAAAAPPPATPAPPAGNPLELVMTECDLTTVIHKNYRPDPTAPGKFYAAYSFDTYRTTKAGKLLEHWDGALINPPPAAAPARAN